MNVAFIPVRGGSKSIPLKNIKEILGKPLVYWTVKAASECEYIDKVYISTDNNTIRDVITSLKIEEENLFQKVEVISRTKESASDTASTEYAMLEFAAKYDFDNIVLIQATSPMLSADDLRGGFQLYETPETDSVLSCVRQYRFLWERNEKGNVLPTNYDMFHRPRRQDFAGYLMENGAFYITSKSGLLQYRNRISGKIKAYEMHEDTAYELDEQSDWIIIETLMRKREFVNKKVVRKVKMFLTDCDGCLTDGGMYYSECGAELKKFNTTDGMGLSILKQKGIITGIVTGEKTKIVERRAQKLQVDEVHQGIKNKMDVIEKLSDKYKVSLDEIAYVGDDLNDSNVMDMVGFPCTVNNASYIIKAKAKYVSKHNGGDGAIREIIDMLVDAGIVE